MVENFAEISAISQLSKKENNLINASPCFHVYQILSINASGFLIILGYCKSDKSLKKSSTAAL